MLPYVLHNKSDEDDAQTDWEFGTGFPLLISAPASASAATATSSEVSFLHRPCFVYREATSAYFFAVELRNCFLRGGVVGHLHKTETFRASGITICDDLNRFNLANLAKHVSQVSFCGLKREIPNIDFFCHLRSIRADPSIRVVVMCA